MTKKKSVKVGRHKRGVEVETMTLKELYISGDNILENFKGYFNIQCKQCGSKKIKIILEDDDDGYCPTCTSPYSRATFKCLKCGQAVSWRTS